MIKKKERKYGICLKAISNVYAINVESFESIVNDVRLLIKQ